MKISFHTDIDKTSLKNEIKDFYSNYHCKIKSNKELLEVIAPFPNWGICDHRLYSKGFPPLNPFVFTGNLKILLDQKQSIIVKIFLFRILFWEFFGTALIYIFYYLNFRAFYNENNFTLFVLLSAIILLTPLIMFFKAILITQKALNQILVITTDI